MKRTGMNEDGKEFMKLILSVIVIVLCSGCFRNNSPISVELSSVERNDTLYLQFEFTNNTEDSLFFVFANDFYVWECGFTIADYGSPEKDFYGRIGEAQYRVFELYPKIVPSDTLSLTFPITKIDWGEEYDLPCVINKMKSDYFLLKDTVFHVPNSPMLLSKYNWLDNELYVLLQEYYEKEKPEFEEFLYSLPSENTILLSPQRKKTIKVDVSYLKYIKAVYSIWLDYVPVDWNDCNECYIPLLRKGYKKYTERLTSNAITIDTRNMKLP